MGQDVEYDAIVVGTGISGGWAAKEPPPPRIKNAGYRTRANGQAY